ncbi:MAG: methionine--tRNA ligase [bacterium]
MSDKPFFLTTAIDYVNNLPHIGTAYEKIGADVLARFRRFEGEQVFFLMGNDEHSINVKKEAQARGMDPKAYCDRMAGQFQEIWAKLHIRFDDFIRTTEERHEKAVRELFRKIHDNGDIYPAKYKGLYCESCETFYREKDLVEGCCPQHRTRPRWIEEENYFFALSRYTDRIRDAIQKGRIRILPEIRRNEIVNLLEAGLEDISISRSTFDWGIPLPIQPNHVVYVWFDALINYISAIGYGWDEARFRRLWPADVHVIGKDITRFHCIIWPAMLLSAGLELPRTVFGHGFVYLKGERMSKTLGNIVNPMDIVDVYGPDALRYYLLRETAFGDDGNFTWDNFIERYNRDLANDLGNLLQRVLTMIHRYRKGKVPAPQGLEEIDRQLQQDCLRLYPDIRSSLDPARGDIHFHLALARIWETIRHANQYVDRTAPWDLYKRGPESRLDTVLYCASECLRIIGIILHPFLPEGGSKLLAQLGPSAAQARIAKEEISAWGGLRPGTMVEQPEPLYPRILPAAAREAEAEAPAGTESALAADRGPLVSIEEFNKIDLRVGRVVRAERVPKTMKLLKLVVDIGELRTIVAGIGKTFEPSSLEGKTLLIVANLQPVRIRGILSEGMLLAVGDPEAHSLVTLSDPGSGRPGERAH